MTTFCVKCERNIKAEKESVILKTLDELKKEKAHLVILLLLPENPNFQKRG
jgi:hypothetical protein